MTTRIGQDLLRLLPGAEREAELEASAETTMQDLIAEIIDSAIDASGVPVERLSKREKVEAVSLMQQRGLFPIRGSVELVAKRLLTTKFTIYNYLDEIGARSD